MNVLLGLALLGLKGAFLLWMAYTHRQVASHVVG